MESLVLRGLWRDLAYRSGGLEAAPPGSWWTASGSTCGVGTLGGMAAGSSMWLAQWLGSGASGTCTLRVRVRAVPSPHCAPAVVSCKPCVAVGAKAFKHTSQPWPCLLPSGAPSPAPCPPVSGAGRGRGPHLGQQLDPLQRRTVLRPLLWLSPVAPVTTRTCPRSGQRLGLQGAGAGGRHASTVLLSPTVTMKSGPVKAPPPRPC